MFSPEKPDVTRDLATKHGVTYPIVFDDTLAIARAFGLAFTLPDDLVAIYVSFGIDLPKNTGHAVWELPMPARFVVDRGAIVRSAEIDPDYTVRPEPEATLAVLRTLR